MPCAGTRVQDARIDSALQALATCNRRLMCSAAAAPDPAKSKMDRRLPRGMGWWTDLVYGGPGRFSSPRRRRYGRTRARPGVHPAMHTRPPAAAQPTLQRVPRARLSCCGSPAAVRRVDGRDGSRGAAETRRASATCESPSSPTRSRRGGCAARRPRPHRAPGYDLCRRRLQASAAPSWDRAAINTDRPRSGSAPPESAVAPARSARAKDVPGAWMTVSGGCPAGASSSQSGRTFSRPARRA